MADFDIYTINCPVALTNNYVTVTFINRVGTEAYVEVTTTYNVTSTLTVDVQVYDDCNMTYRTVAVTISSGTNYGNGTSSGYGACGTITGSGSSISPSSDSTYNYLF